jgi:hypothetical protein
MTFLESMSSAPRSVWSRRHEAFAAEEPETASSEDTSTAEFLARAVAEFNEAPCCRGPFVFSIHTSRPFRGHDIDRNMLVTGDRPGYADPDGLCNAVLQVTSIFA